MGNAHDKHSTNGICLGSWVLHTMNPYQSMLGMSDKIYGIRAALRANVTLAVTLFDRNTFCDQEALFPIVQSREPERKRLFVEESHLFEEGMNLRAHGNTQRQLRHDRPAWLD